MTRRPITRDMIERAAQNGWNVNRASVELGFSCKSVACAAHRFGIALTYGQADRAASRDKLRMIEAADNTRVKAFSASPRAIARAVEKLEAVR